MLMRLWTLNGRHFILKTPYPHNTGCTICASRPGHAPIPWACLPRLHGIVCATPSHGDRFRDFGRPAHADERAWGGPRYASIVVLYQCGGFRPACLCILGFMVTSAFKSRTNAIGWGVVGTVTIAVSEQSPEWPLPRSFKVNLYDHAYFKEVCRRISEFKNGSRVRKGGAATCYDVVVTMRTPPSAPNYSTRRTGDHKTEQRKPLAVQ